MNFGDWMQLLRDYWRSLGAAVVAGTIAGVVATAMAQPMYTSTGQILFSAARNARSDGQDVAYAGQYLTSRMQTYQLLARSDKVIDPAAAALDEDGSDLADRVGASYTPETTVLDVSVTATSAAKARDAAEEVSRSLVAAVVTVDGPDADNGATTPVVRGELVGNPGTPASASSPRPAVNVLAGALFGFLVGLGAALVRRLRRSGQAG